MAAQGSNGQEGTGSPAPAGGLASASAKAGDDSYAYEADWYRSLKALAARQAELRARDGDEDEEAESQASQASQTSQTAEESQAAEEYEAAQASSTAPGSASATSTPETAEQDSSDGVVIHLGAQQVERFGVGGERAVPVEPADRVPGPEAAPPEETDEIESLTPTNDPDASAATESEEESPSVERLSAAASEPSLDAVDANLRRRALVELARRGLQASDIEHALRLAMDPDQSVRRQALAVLGSQADLLPDSNVQQALHDPNDDVRAEAVRLAALRGDRDLIHLLPLLALRRAAATQAAALQVIPDLVASGDGLTEEQFTTALRAVADLESAPNEAEVGPLTELSRGIGVGRLVAVLGVGDDRHLGACRLLWLEGSVAAMRGLADQIGDPIEEIRDLATQAAARVAEMESLASPDAASPPEQILDGEMILALARALEDPDDSARERATEALNEMDVAQITSWARDALRGDDAEMAKLAAGVVGLRRVVDVVSEVIDRGASVHGERQEPYRKALAALPVDVETLVAALGAVAPERVPHAVRLLWDVAGRAALPLLEQSLTYPSPDVRIAVLDVLGSSGDPSAMDAAGGVLASDSVSDVRVAAIAVLAHGTEEQRLTSLARALNDPDSAVRATAVSTLPIGLGSGAMEPLTQALNDPDERVWHAALQHLGSLQMEDLSVVWAVLTRARPDQREGLIAALEQADTGKVAELAIEHAQSTRAAERELALTIAGHGQSEECAVVCVAGLQDPVVAVRHAAATSLGMLGRPASAEALGASLSDPDPGVRVAAIRSLGRIDSEAVLGFLVKAFQDPAAEVRDASSAVLTEWSSPAVARRLAGVLATPSLQHQATDLLVRLGASAMELLIDVLIHSSAEMRPMLGSLLERIVGTDVFAARLAMPDPVQRRRAIIAIGGIGGPRAVEFSLRALGDPDQEVRIAALEALGHLGEAGTAAEVQRCAEADPVPEVVDAARQTLATLLRSA